MASKMYIEKSLEYTVKGIEILRDETIQLFQNRNNYLSFGTGAITLLFYSAATSQYNYPFLTYVVLLLAIPLLSCFLIIISLYINVLIAHIGRYLRSREMLLTYLLESIYEDNQEVSNFGNNNNLTYTQEKIKKLLFGKEIRDIHFLDHQIINNQIPIYWERYMLNPIPDKLKVIDLQSYMITWMFSIIALMSYCTGLIFRASVEKRCPEYDTTIIWQCKTNISELNFFNDINFFRDYNLKFSDDLFTKFPNLEGLSNNFNNQSDTQLLLFSILVLAAIYLVFFLLRFKKSKIINIAISVIIVLIFRYFYDFSTNTLFDSTLFYPAFLFILLMTLLFNIFGENLIFTVRQPQGKELAREELTAHISTPIFKDYYSLFLNLTSFLIVMYFLRFYTELSVFIIILSTFSYSIFWQIPQFRKTAHRPLNEDIFIEENYYD
jgi:hypothetical protein